MTRSASNGAADAPVATRGPVPLAYAGARSPAIRECTLTSFDGHTFVLNLAGSGPPILLLHDMGASARQWDPVRPLLVRSHRVGTWDARGHGSARGTPESAVPTLGLLAADLHAAILACAPERPVLVGHALGALTILEYLRAYDAGLVSRVVLVDQTPRMMSAPDWALGLFNDFWAGDAFDFEARIRNDFAEAWLMLHARGFNARAGAEYESGSAHVEALRRDLATLSHGSMLSLWRSAASRDYRVDLAQLPVPLLAVLGGSSNLYDTAQLGRWIAQSVPGATVVRYDSADHAPHLCAPARFARDVVAFAAHRTAASLSATGTPMAAISGDAHAHGRLPRLPTSAAA